MAVAVTRRGDITPHRCSLRTCQIGDSANPAVESKPPPSPSTMAEGLAAGRGQAAFPHELYLLAAASAGSLVGRKLLLHAGSLLHLLGVEGHAAERTERGRHLETGLQALPAKPEGTKGGTEQPSSISGQEEPGRGGRGAGPQPHDIPALRDSCAPQAAGQPKNPGTSVPTGRNWTELGAWEGVRGEQAQPKPGRSILDTQRGSDNAAALRPAAGSGVECSQTKTSAEHPGHAGIKPVSTLELGSPPFKVLTPAGA